ncbi:Glycosyltransferase, catalytic subunit of cellulose synthase and poly-beta-1,6-N-acetylglucosamine synthase [Granulicella rosea]|uniref:Glycosyltransferase, catalytic subunit of cellulose synthase and poly-beta-1,6-N-acetylglucosamine synthase n=1 Tax=Granulicella rosea TaxID=474952 RepID=A0A239HXE6_9BACT|nr:glycosyltransferase family 2 protein [Granulicella rosea]SNS85931.1 Glycosyltransferase, catalytic subunit of cellulose synthase and poly-beta-1,6-N-acetylglucosamine synthase [Granulicella rosea]
MLNPLLWSAAAHSLRTHPFPWLVAFAWTVRVAGAARGLPGVPNLLLPEFDRTPADNPSITVIVPALNEQEKVAACLESLLRQDYPNLQILAVDDRSTDRTGTIMDELSAAHPDKLKVIHITELPPQWLGKTHAMATAAARTTSEYLLFTDADILFTPGAIRRSLAYAVESKTDHLVTFPTTIIHRWDEAALLGFFQIFGLWAARPWKVADPRAKRDAIGIGAFNLVRREAYEQIGGFTALRMEIVEDLGLGRRIKRAGLAQRVAFARGMVRVHWAAGVPGLINVMTKNTFSAFNFHISLLLIGCAWLACFCVAPFVWILLPSGAHLPAAIAITAVLYAYKLVGRHSGISAWNGLLAPFAASVFIYTLLRSMVTTLRQGGVYWRGTFYRLKELRENAAPLF